MFIFSTTRIKHKNDCFLFFRSDRITVQEREKMELDLERKEEEKKKIHEERTKTSRKVIK